MMLKTTLSSVGLFVLVSSFTFQLSIATDGFLFTMPEVLRYGDISEFCLTVYGAVNGSKIVTMSMIDRSDPKVEIVLKDIYANGEQTCNNFTVPKAGEYEMLLYNSSHILHDSVLVKVEDHSLITLVQTDKPMYKPGQTVKFRIVTFKSDSKPRIGMIAAVYIQDPNDIRVKQFLSVDSQGIASLEFPLAKGAKLGMWRIQVHLNDSSVVSRVDGFGTFVVKEYVLPRFEVNIIPPDFILANDEVIEGKVCAIYTYGKPVRGFVDIEVCLSNSWDFSLGTCFHAIEEFTGCHNFSVNATELQGDISHLYNIQLAIKASVTENGTGAIVNATKKGPEIKMFPLNIELDDYTNGFFKPGLPFFGKVIVTKPDGSPAIHEDIKVTATDYKNNLEFSANFTTDTSGIIVYALCGAFNEKSSTININAIATRYNEDLGDNHNGMYTPSSYMTITQWFSPSLSYIEIPRTETKHKCGDRLTLSIPFTTRAKTNTDFKYQVMAGGKIIKTGKVNYRHDKTYPGLNLVKPPSHICLQWKDMPTPPPPPTYLPPVDKAPEIIETLEMDLPESPPEVIEDGGEQPTGNVEVEEMILNDDFEEPIIRSKDLSDIVSNFLLDIPISTIMAPKFRLLIFHTLPDGEVVADSMEYHVEDCLDNDVKFAFNRSRVLPGEKVSINVEAAPGSLCSIGIVDKSVNILGGEHQITRKTISEKLEAFRNTRWVDNYHSDREYCGRRMKKYKEKEETEMEMDFWSYSSSYVDSLQAFLSSGYIVLTNLKLQTRPCGRSYPVFYEPVPLSGAVPGPGAVGPIPQVYHSGPISSAVDTRSHFPETWLWDLQIIGVNGSEDIEQTAPHTITSWTGSALCLDADKGIGVSALESLTTFQPFFTHIQLPYSAVRGERLPVMVNIFNYLEKCINVELTVEGMKGLTIHGEKIRQKCLCGGESSTAKFYVTPTDTGSIPIIAKGEIIPGACDNTTEMDEDYIGLTDSVKRNIFVKAEGIMDQYTFTIYMCPKDKGLVENLILPLPEKIVKDSQWGEVKVIGDIMGPALTNLDNLVQMPTGCGEQNMVGFTPNIYVLKYLYNTKQLTEEIEKKATNHLEIGYQRELTYRHNDGSFSAFGKSDKAGSVWLTAFVVKSFAQAKSYIFIDDKELKNSIYFLRRSQLETGCFRETGKVLSSYMMGGLGKRKSSSFTALTSYVLISLLQADVNSSESVIVNGFKCLSQDFKRDKGKMETYSLSILAYAYTLYDPESRMAMDIMRTLDKKAKTDGSVKFWTRDGPPPPSHNHYSYAAPSAEVEMTSYALLAYLEFYGMHAASHTHQIAMWLSQQRSPQGGFASTQDTVVGLNALSEFAILAFKDGPTNLVVSVGGNDFSRIFYVSESRKNLLLSQTVEIPSLPSSISISARGTGCALVQTNVRFNKTPRELHLKKPGFFLRVSALKYNRDINRCDRKTLKIGVSSRHNQRHSKGMSLVTVKLVTSWTPVPDSLTKLRSRGPLIGLKKHEYDETHGEITFYFDELGRKLKEFSFDVEQDRNMAVSAPKPAEVKVFQYYENDVYEVRSYNLKTICGTKAEIPRRKGPVPLPIDLLFPSQVRIGGATSPLPMEALTPDMNGCPTCINSKNIAENMETIFCNSSTVYKAVTGRNGQYPIKLRHDLRGPKKVKVNTFVVQTMEEGCICSLLKPPVHRVFIFTSNEVNKKKLVMDANTYIVKGSRNLEKQFKKWKRNCPL